MDLNVLEKGEDYNKLKQSYVNFICTFDPFGKGLSCYEFENICKYQVAVKNAEKTVKNRKSIEYWVMCDG